jgi:hypothetical protein
MITPFGASGSSKPKRQKPAYQARQPLGESLPLDHAVSEDLYRWLSMETFEGCENLFRYHLSDEEYRKFRYDFVRKKKDYPGPSRL